MRDSTMGVRDVLRDLRLSGRSIDYSTHADQSWQDRREPQQDRVQDDPGVRAGNTVLVTIPFKTVFSFRITL
jgi:hypothetical protein